jgi:hypothetical protein
MIVYDRINDHVIHSQIFILLWLLFDVMLCCSLESVYKSKAKKKYGKRFPQGFLIEFLINKYSGNIKSEGDAASE